MKRVLVYLFIGVFGYLIIPSSSFAAVSVGGGPISVTKSVLNPSTNMYVHSLSLNDPMYKPGDTITFHVTVANSSNETFNNVIVEDVFPDYVSFISGTGSFDTSSKTLTFSVNNLQPNTTQTFAVMGQVADANSLPTNQGSICAANRVLLKVNGVQASHDSSSFCIQKVFPPTVATTTPSTGPEALPLATLFGSMISGILLKKKTK